METQIRTWMTAATALGVALAGGAAEAETQTPPVTSFGIAFKPFDATLSKKRRSVEITKPFPQDNPRYYRLRVKIDNPEQEAWTITIRSPAGQILSTFDQEETGCEDPTGCWTKRLNSSLPTVHFATGSDRVRAEIADALYMPERAEHPFYSPMPGSTIEPLAAMSFSDRDQRRAMYELADSLGLFIGSGITADGSALANWCCSGVRLTRDLFITNWHCGAASGMRDAAYWPESGGNACEVGIVDMSWDGDDIGQEFSCEAVEFARKDLDVAILRLGKLADGAELSRPLSRPALSSDEIRTGDDISILHHPACEPKSVTRGCTILKTGVRSWTGAEAGGPATEFTHNCTTENGSSGGLVFSSARKMIGLHHLGVDITREEAGNFAVDLSSILQAVRRENPALYNEIAGSGDAAPSAPMP